VFGGPLELELSGIDHGPKPLHMIALLSSAHVPALGKHHLFELPLIYGMCYDGCKIQYRVDIVGRIELRELSSVQATDSWPYRNFPL
jgi:hypothetical protein